jgi:hypothetical protein
VLTLEGQILAVLILTVMVNRYIVCISGSVIDKIYILLNIWIQQ